MPDRTRKVQVRAPMVAIDTVFVKRATAQGNIRSTTVLIAVAMLEFTWATPTLASTAVSPAKNAESKAQINQLMCSLCPSASLFCERSPRIVKLDQPRYY